MTVVIGKPGERRSYKFKTIQKKNHTNLYVAKRRDGPRNELVSEIGLKVL